MNFSALKPCKAPMHEPFTDRLPWATLLPDEADETRTGADEVLPCCHREAGRGEGGRREDEGGSSGLVAWRLGNEKKSGKGLATEKVRL